MCLGTGFDVVGQIYEQIFKSELFPGYGTLTYQNGEKYDGYWRQDKASFIVAASFQHHERPRVK